MNPGTDPKPDDRAGAKAPIKGKAIVIALSLVCCLVCLEAGLRVLGATVMSAQAHRNALAMRRTGVYRVMCVGDSMTQGQYPPFLEQALNGRNMGIRFSVIDSGRIFTDSLALLRRLEADLDAYHPNIVVAMMGINDNGPHMLYEPEARSKIARFIKALRTYKLARIAWQRIVSIRSRGRNAPHGAASDRAYVELGRLYQVQGKPAEAAVAYKKALEINPGNGDAYVGLGWYYYAQRKLAEAEGAFTKALNKNLKHPSNEEGYVGLAWVYRAQGKLAEAVAADKKALEIDPGNISSTTGLSWVYRAQHKYAEAEDILEKALKIDPGNDIAYQQLVQVYQAQGRPAEATALRKKTEELRLKEYDSVVADNYHRLKEILDRRGIQLVCVQYPMRSLAPLRKMFQGRDHGIIFVDNEHVFKDAVKRSSSKEYFVDMFAGDFGHCTRKGNQLLAESIADVLRREYVGK
jgi:tetratricopeptide (TPR) repeat protein